VRTNKIYVNVSSALLWNRPDDKKEVTELMGKDGEDAILVNLLQDGIVQHDALVLPEAIEVGLQQDDNVV
jgi:hypothetical protein